MIGFSSDQGRDLQVTSTKRNINYLNLICKAGESEGYITINTKISLELRDNSPCTFEAGNEN